MISPWAILIVCICVLVYQARQQFHERMMKADLSEIEKLTHRVEAIEQAKKVQYDHQAFEELKSKVESVRISMGLKHGR